MIEPRTLKGFRDYLPSAMIPREQLLDTARRVYQRFGFVPIDTPALEYLEILTGKGSEETDRQLYHFQDKGGRAVGMRFDLTVPLARFVAQHASELQMPFKRYHIGAVWRGESPQAGRFREFCQCDFDTIGTESVVADIETVLIIHQLFCELGVPEITIRVNHRQILNGFLRNLKVEDRSTFVLRAIDKLEKQGEEVVRSELQQLNLQASEIDSILRLIGCQGEADAVLTELSAMIGEDIRGQAGIERLKQVASAVRAVGVTSDRFRIDPSIARGLDYYTGMIVETTLTELPSIGSVCSGGRYDNLAGLFTKQHLPGVGASLGLDRLLAALEQLGRLPASSTTAQVFIPYFDAHRLLDYMELASVVRQAGWNVEVFPEPKKLGQQLKYADQRQFKIALIAGSDELDRGVCQVKDLRHKIGTEASWRSNAGPLLSAIENIVNISEGRHLVSIPAS